MTRIWHTFRATIARIFAEPAEPVACTWSDIVARCASQR